MNNRKIVSLLSLCLFAITSYSRNNHFVEVEAISKYYFQLENTTVVPLLVELRLSEAAEVDLFVLNAGHERSYPIRDIGRGAYLKISYPRNLRVVFEQSVLRDKDIRELWEETREKATGILIDDKWREGEENRDRILDQLGKELLNSTINNWLGGGNRKEIEELKKLLTESAYISAVWDARTSDQHAWEFDKRDLRQEARAWRFFKGGLSGSLNVDMSFPMYYSNLGEAWRYQTPFKGHSLSASVMLLPDWTWWNSGRV